MGYGSFSICVIHKEGLCPSSGDINRLMMMRWWWWLIYLHRVGQCDGNGFSSLPPVTSTVSFLTMFTRMTETSSWFGQTWSNGSLNSKRIKIGIKTKTTLCARAITIAQHITPHKRQEGNNKKLGKNCLRARAQIVTRNGMQILKPGAMQKELFMQ
jgi:hypothetical protein